jgi:hypothetical protein
VGKYVKDDPNPAYKGFIPWAKSAGFWTVDFRGTQYKLDDLNRNGTDTDPGEGSWWDYDGDGKLSDDERDEDADGLSNYDEVVGPMQPGWWAGCFKDEHEYPVSYAGTDPTDPDTDGDGVRDGADDQDHDDLPNLMELDRVAAGGTPQGSCGNPVGTPNSDPMDVYVNPFNPCLPYIDSRTCLRHPAFESPPAPFGADTKLYVLR